MAAPTHPQDPFNARATLDTPLGRRTIYRLDALRGIGDVHRLPYSIKILLEACLRNLDHFIVTEDHVKALASYGPDRAGQEEIPFMPGRVVLQDFTGVPAVVDLAAMREGIARMTGDKANASKVNPLVPCDLVIDHSVQVDAFNSGMALSINSQKEFERNQERYQFLKWGQKAFDNFRVVPPATGIVHQVNLEYLAKVVWEGEGPRGQGAEGPSEEGAQGSRGQGEREEAAEAASLHQTSDIRHQTSSSSAPRPLDPSAPCLYPDSLVGTDSHTTMINGLGVLGWGVGGIEAEAVMLGQPVYMLIPEVIGVKLTGKLAEGCTATDLVLRVTEMLRQHGVVGKFVEFFGPALADMPLANRATIANMAPEYGATMGFFPVDEQTLKYMHLTGRDEKLIQTVEQYCKAQGLWHDEHEVDYIQTLELNLATVEPALAGPRRPQDRIILSGMKSQWQQDLSVTFGKSTRTEDSTNGRFIGEGGESALAASGTAVVDEASSNGNGNGVKVEYDGSRFTLKHGSVVIAAITSCTNTSNPDVMVAAGLVARKARAKGLTRKPWVKTSLAPGSKVVTEYLDRAKLTEDLEAAGFYLVGYGCTTCIGNSGPLPEEIAQGIREGDLVAAAVLSGNRNFEGRINPDIKANYLASPPLVVAYALAGTVNIDLTHEPLGKDKTGQDVYLKDIWPTQAEVDETVHASINREQFVEQYADVFAGSEEWQAVQTSGGALYDWNGNSTYIQQPPFFVDLTPKPQAIQPIHGARCLGKFGDSVTTDHISPAGSIKKDGPAGKYLQEHNVPVSMFNSFGSRRGNHEVMMRGTFANVRVRNQLAPGTEGGYTTDYLDGQVKSIYDAAMHYQQQDVPLVVLAGTDYGMGSSRDWAAKGTYLLGVQAVIAASFERIHRSNLVGMGVLPLQFEEGQTHESLGLDGTETFDIAVDDGVQPRQKIAVTATKADGEKVKFTTVCRIDTPVEVNYYRNGGILHTVLRRMAEE